MADIRDRAIDSFQVPSDDLIACPWPFYHALLDEAPVHKPDGYPLYIVSRYDDVQTVLRDPDTYSSDWYHALSNPHPEVAAILAQGCPRKDVLVTADPPFHRRYRRLVEKAFTPARVRGMEDYIATLIDTLIDGFIDRGEADFIREFAVPLPISIIADALGVPRSDMDRFKRWSDAALVPLSRTAPLDERKAAAYQKLEMQSYMAEMLQAKRASPQDDLASALAVTAFEDEVDEAGEPRLLDLPEFIQIVESFIVAGNETTTNALGAGILHLIRRPELIKRLRSEPTLLPAFAEEILRLEAPIQGEPRITSRAVQLAGVDIPKGALIDVRLGAANRDARQFPTPDEIDLDRRNGNSHVSFGSGIHFCIGSALVRRELPMAFAALLSRLDNIRLADPAAEPDYVHSFMVRGLNTLRIRFDRYAEP